MSSVLDAINEKLRKMNDFLAFPDTPAAIPVFNGETHTVSFTEFIEKFQLVARMRKWTDKQRALCLPGYLGGYALEVYRQFSDRIQADFHALINALETKFIIAEGAKYAALEMRSRSLQPGEGIAGFAAELRKLARAAYPNFSEAARDRLALEKFISCVPTEMRLDLMNKEPEDLHEAVNCAKKFSMRQKIIQNSCNENRLVQMQNEIEETIEPNAIDATK